MPISRGKVPANLSDSDVDAHDAMDYEKLRRQLLLRGRSGNPSVERVPYAFEQKSDGPLPAIIRSEVAGLGFWTRGFWRAALSGITAAGIMVGSLGVVSDREVGEAILSPVESLEAILAPAQAEVEP